MIIASSRVTATNKDVSQLFHHLTDHIFKKKENHISDNQDIEIYNRNQVLINGSAARKLIQNMLKFSKASSDKYAIRHAWINSKEKISDQARMEIIEAYEEEFGIDPVDHIRINFRHKKPLVGGDEEGHDHLIWLERGLTNKKIIQTRSIPSRNEKMSRIAEVLYDQETTLGKHNYTVLKNLYDTGFNLESREYKRSNNAQRQRAKVMYRQLCDRFCQSLIEKNHALIEEGIDASELISDADLRERFEQAKQTDLKAPYEVLKQEPHVFGNHYISKARYSQTQYQIAKDEGWAKEFKEAIQLAGKLWSDYAKDENFEHYLEQNGFKVKMNPEFAEYQENLALLNMGLYSLDSRLKPVS